MFDDAIVGAGIVGLAHAYELAKRGRRVVVLERSPRAVGASIRNFGMLWPIGRPAGESRELALESLAIWRDVLQSTGIWFEKSGSLHAARSDDEARVLKEFAEQANQDSFACEWLDPASVVARSPRVRLEGLIGGLFSPNEICVDPRRVVAELPLKLARDFEVAFVFGAEVVEVDPPRVRTANGDEYRAKNVIICSGSDIGRTFPNAFAEIGLVPCKLQMMRTAPIAEPLGPMLAAGLTLKHYPGFAACPSLAHLIQRFEREFPRHVELGIHVLVSQTPEGELTIGDSHEYGPAIEPFDKTEIDDLILSYLNLFFDSSDLKIASRWHGVYLKHPSADYAIARPAEGVILVNGVGGAGMTLSFGIAARTANEILGIKAAHTHAHTIANAELAASRHVEHAENANAEFPASRHAEHADKSATEPVFQRNDP